MIIKDTVPNYIRNRKSVDDMIIDDYFTNKEQENTKSTPNIINSHNKRITRVHSRIPDRRQKRMQQHHLKYQQVLNSFEDNKGQQDHVLLLTRMERYCNK